MTAAIVFKKDADLVSDWGLAVSFTATASNHTQQVVQY